MSWEEPIYRYEKVLVTACRVKSPLLIAKSTPIRNGYCYGVIPILSGFYISNSSDMSVGIGTMLTCLDT